MSDVSDEPENAVVNLSDPEVKSLLLAWLKTVEQRHNNVCRPLFAALMSAGEALKAAKVAEAAVANDTSKTVDALAAAVRLAKAVDATWSAFLSNGPPNNVIIKSIEILEDEESRATTANRQTPTSDNDREKETNNDNDGNSNNDASSTCDETPPLTQLSKKLTRSFNNALEAMEVHKGVHFCLNVSAILWLMLFWKAQDSAAVMKYAEAYISLVTLVVTFLWTYRVSSWFIGRYATASAGISLLTVGYLIGSWEGLA
jgi:hypothetical protein